MPLTLAHPAAAVPLVRVLGPYGVLSALVIGSIAPDTAYLLGLGVPRSTSHGVVGLFVYCLPVGLALFALFHVVLKHPLAALLPAPLQARIAPELGAVGRLPSVPFLAVVVSLLAGAATHVVWDSFTHLSSPLVQAVPELRAHLFSVFGYPVFACKLLQHASTGAGLALLADWSWRWLRAPGQTAALPRPRLPFVLRGAVVAGLLAVSTCAALEAAAPALEAAITPWTLRRFLGRALVGGAGALALALVSFCLIWHVHARALRLRA
jgi:uncharacterized protein DUF4184